MQDSLEAALSNSSVDCAQMDTSGVEFGTSVEVRQVNEEPYLLPSFTHILGPEVAPTSLNSVAPAAVNDRTQYTTGVFQPSAVHTTNETSSLVLDPSPSFDQDQDCLAWENLDFGDLDWCLFESFPLENAETLARGSAPVDNLEPCRPEVADAAANSAPTAMVVERSWFAKLENGSATRTNPSEIDQSGSATPSGNEDAPRTEINEGYRQSLSSRLRPRLSDEPLPSTDFLVSGRPCRLVGAFWLTCTSQKMCIQMYFSRANPSLPILHAPTFRPTSNNGGLLLSICSIGCLFLGTSEAAHYGSLLFERLLRAMMASV